jgi:hypothetical protein
MTDILYGDCGDDDDDIFVQQLQNMCHKLSVSYNTATCFDFLYIIIREFYYYKC